MTINIPEGSAEPLLAELTSELTTFTDQPVYFGVSDTGGRPTTWHAGEWVGDPGKKRVARWNYDGTLPPKRRYTVFARITDDPAQPVIRVGSIYVY